MGEPDQRLSEFDKLNAVGKAVFLGGTAVKLLASGIDFALNRAADLVVDIEKSFKDGLDPNIEEAKILEERESSRSSRSSASSETSS